MKLYIKTPPSITQDDLPTDRGEQYLTAGKVYEYIAGSITDDVGDKILPLTTQYNIDCAHLNGRGMWIFCNKQGEEL